MKTVLTSISFFALLILIVSCTGKQAENIPLPCDSTKNYKLIWSEEFNYSGLPDTTKWGYEVGFIRNHEKQYYTQARVENARVENGMLVIESRKEAFKGFDYTSASINTLGKASFGVNTRVEVCAKLPAGKGMWPAIWSMGTDFGKIGWPRCGEIDIMEFVGHTPNTVWGTFHWWDASKPDSSIHLQKGDTLQFFDLQQKFHVYGVERTAGKLSFFVDTDYYFDFDSLSNVETDLFKKPFYILINTALGGDWGGEIDTTIFPQKMYVDWVRVFEIPSEHK
jgi:beta-glucanase (GH16 family)